MWKCGVMNIIKKEPKTTNLTLICTTNQKKKKNLEYLENIIIVIYRI